MSTTVTTLASVRSGCCDCCVRELRLHWQAIDGLTDFRKHFLEYLPKQGCIESDPEIRRLREDVDELRNAEPREGETPPMEALKDEIESLRRARKEDYELIVFLKQARKEDQDEFETWKKSVRKMRQDIDDLRTEVSGMAVLESSIVDLKDKVASLESEIAQLRGRGGASSAVPTPGLSGVASAGPSTGYACK